MCIHIHIKTHTLVNIFGIAATSVTMLSNIVDSDVTLTRHEIRRSLYSTTALGNS